MQKYNQYAFQDIHVRSSFVTVGRAYLLAQCGVDGTSRSRHCPICSSSVASTVLQYYTTTPCLQTNSWFLLQCHDTWSTLRNRPAGRCRHSSNVVLLSCTVTAHAHRPHSLSITRITSLTIVSERTMHNTARIRKFSWEVCSHGFCSSAQKLRCTSVFSSSSK